MADAARSLSRPEVRGKFLYTGAEKLYLAGVTYGPFAPGPDGTPYRQDAADRDFAQMAAQGFNAVRTYTPPPRWLLDAAARHGLSVMAGLAWEQHIAFLDQRRTADAIVASVAGDVRDVAGHPALMGWAVGNEIPTGVVRWYGARKVQRFLRRLHDAVKAEDPEALVTYVNYPSTEYLELDFVDLVCFNVFLEVPDRFEAYLDRLQNLAGDRPLLLTEIGLDSLSHGEERQAASLDWQVRGALTAGCAGAFVFSWTDEWHRGGAEIDGWAFGLTDRDRRPRPALHAVSRAFEEAPLKHDLVPVRASVAICTYNGARTLEETARAVEALRYPDFEVIVVDDGSQDDSAAIAHAHGFRVISTENRGLSSARNTALEAATGEFVAYLDDDAAPDPHWLTYLADSFRRRDCVAVGGPNLPVPNDGLVADAVAMAPGNPNHVLTSDREAEHIPGCNAAFRCDALREIGGFDARFRIAGDDVDVCWRLLDRGWKIAYHPAAVVFHHRRDTVGGYLRQQRGYGRAEAMLERKWPERYSAGGHVTWRGRVYGPGTSRAASGPLRWKVYHGVWGTALFQSLYEPARGDMNAVLLMPEAYLFIGSLAALVALGAFWAPLFVLFPVLVFAAGALAVRAVVAASSAALPTPGLSASQQLQRRVLTGLLYVIQPLVRLEGRLRSGLTPWRRRGEAGHVVPRPQTISQWSGDWSESTDRIRALEEGLVEREAVVRRGADFDAWDLEVRGGTLAGVQVSTLVEEHGQDGQHVRWRCRPVWSATAVTLIVLLTALAVVAAADRALIAAAILGVFALSLGLRTASEGGSAMAVTRSVLVDDAETAA
ncbi:MAG: glycosyltransferase [Solirubrobacteraceae bacterium]